jgi:pimeloyl-ACP methyl ester carboxylesterase
MGPEPRDARQITSELHTLLANAAGIEGPYVLVGHSFGGMYMQTYAARYPDEVAGVALADSPSDPDQFSQRPEGRDSYEPQKQSFAVVPLLVRLGVSLPARLGVVRLLSKLDPASSELPQQREQIDALTPSTRQWSTSTLEFLAPTQTLRLGSPGSLGNKPLAVVTAGESEPSWLERQDELATLSSNSIRRVVEGATHTSLMYDRSDAQATSAAIEEVVAAVRNDRQLAR